MKPSKIFITLGIVAGIAFSCNRDETNIADNATTQEIVQSETVAEVATDSNVDLAMDFATTFENTFSLRTTSGGHHPDYPCATVTVASTNGSFPKTITVDFGTTGCTDKKGVTRKGKIIITITNKLFVPGASLTIAQQDFYVNGNKIEGEMVLTNTTENAVPSFSKTITNGKITFADARYFTFSSSRKWKMAEGMATPLVMSDDVWEIYEGNQNIERSNGTYFTSIVKTSLIKKNSCHNIVKGSVYLKGSKIDGTLDFGNGDCDNQATFTDAAGNVTQITVKH